MSELFQNRHFGLRRLPDGLFLLTRTAERFDTVSEMEASMTELNAALDRLGRAQSAVLIDSREAPPRNDAEFEEAFAPLRRRMLSGWRRSAVLVRTEVGRLQVRRHARLDGSDVGAFRDEDGALEWLRR